MWKWIIIAVGLAMPAVAQDRLQTLQGPVIIETIARGLDTPWAVAPLPDGSFLITDRDGVLLMGLPGEGITRIAGVPKVWTQGQGGLLDVVAARDFASTQEIFMTYSAPGDGGAATAVAVAKLDAGAKTLRGVTEIFRMNAHSPKARHFGSRVVEATDGTLFVTIGDRADAARAQSLDVHNGKVIRINRDGSVPEDNPFVSGPTPEVWSLGHRNAQGAALDLRGQLWIVEHGAAGGDEVNQPMAGKNYGWPVISYGRHYSGGKIGEGTSKPGMEQPMHYWDPSIAPSGMMIYSGKLWPDWRGDIFVGSLKFDYISRLEAGANAGETEQLFRDRFIRIRDIREAPDGTIWFLAVGDGALYRMRPG